MRANTATEGSTCDVATDGRNVISTHYENDAYRDLPLPEPLNDAFLFRQEPRLDLPNDYTALDIILGEQIQIEGYTLDETAVPIG